MEKFGCMQRKRIELFSGDVIIRKEIEAVGVLEKRLKRTVSAKYRMYIGVITWESNYLN